MTPLVQVGQIDVVPLSRKARYRAPLPVRSPEIKRAVCDVFGITITDIESRRRARHISWPRQVGYWASRQVTVKSLMEIARDFRVDHQSVIYGIRCVEYRMERSPDYRAKCLKVIEQMEGK